MVNITTGIPLNYLSTCLVLDVMLKCILLCIEPIIFTDESTMTACILQVYGVGSNP